MHYTTGTVGTCLNHPSKGKTQLFRRNVSLDLLVEIFRNPRIHTNTGYYRKNSSQSWKSIQEDGREVFEVDSAQRWRYVASATGLSKTDNELARIAKFCNLYDSMYWDRGQEPRLSQKRYGCGSITVLTNMLLEVAEELLGCPVKFVFQGETSEKEHPEVSLSWNPCCPDRDKAFLAEHRGDVYDLKHMLQGLRRDIRIEMIDWFCSRDHCGYHLTNANDQSRIFTSRTDAVHSAHFHYADLAYTKKSAAMMCQFHGVLYEG